MASCASYANGRWPLAPHALCSSNTLMLWLKQVYVFEQGLKAA